MHPRMAEPAGKNNLLPPGLWTALLVTAIVRAVTVTLLLTVFWGTPAVSHLVQDIRTWRDFFAETQAGAIPYVNLTKEYRCWAGSSTG